MNILTNIEKGTVIAAEDVLHVLVGAEKVVAVAEKVFSPKSIAAMGVIFGAVEKLIAYAQIDVTNPTNLLNFTLDMQQAADVKAVWAALKAELAVLGIKA